MKYCVGVLLGTAVLGLILFGVNAAKIAETQRAIDAVQHLGGVVYHSDLCYRDGRLYGPLIPLDAPGWRTRCARAIGPEWFFDVVHVDFMGYRKDSVVTDRDLAILREFPNLLYLNLAGTEITDEGLKHVAGLTKLRILNLWGTAVTDAGLGHLAGLKRLKIVDIDDTYVTGQGVDRLKRAIPGVTAGAMYETDMERWRKLSDDIDNFMKSRRSQDSAELDTRLTLE